MSGLDFGYIGVLCVYFKVATNHPKKVANRRGIWQKWKKPHVNKRAHESVCLQGVRLQSPYDCAVTLAINGWREKTCRVAQRFFCSRKFF